MLIALAAFASEYPSWFPSINTWRKSCYSQSRHCWTQSIRFMANWKILDRQRQVSGLPWSWNVNAVTGSCYLRWLSTKFAYSSARNSHTRSLTLRLSLLCRVTKANALRQMEFLRSLETWSEISQQLNFRAITPLPIRLICNRLDAPAAHLGIVTLVPHTSCM